MSTNTLENVASGETYTFLRRAEETAGELLQLRWSARPGGRVAEHVHPAQEESFEIIQGELTVSLGRQLSVFRVGERVTVPAGARHCFANRGTTPVAAILELRPALRMQHVFESLAGLAREGKVRKGGLPRNPLQLAAFAHEFEDEIRGVSPPYAVQRAVVPPLAALARALGVRGYYPRYAEAVRG